MARKRDENRDKAKQIYLDTDGLASNSDIAEALNIDSAKVRRWKHADKWREALENKPRKRGGQKGNKNAKGHGAPVGNKNAETHGAYSTIHLECLPEEERRFIESLTLDSTENMLRELQILIAKERDLQRRIEIYRTDERGELHTDKVIETRAPSEANELCIVNEMAFRSSAFERIHILEAELNKIHGRIIKLLDSIKSYELEQRRLSLDEKRYKLMKQKISGVYEVDPDTGEIDDIYESGEAAKEDKEDVP